VAKRYGLVIDLERCTGCHTCTVACKVENKIEVGSGIRVETVGGGHRDAPAGKYPQLSMHYLPMTCMHCAQPPCRDVCPTEAINQRPDGVVLIDEGKCNGCQECMTACPYQALVYDAERVVVRKCNLCLERIDQGFQPFCAVCCGDEAIFFGDLSDPQSKVSKLIAERSAYTLNPELATVPAIYYCPPYNRRQTQSAPAGAPRTGILESATSTDNRVMVKPGEKVIRTACPLSCGPGCGILAHVKDGVLVKVEPGDFPGTSHVCPRSLAVTKLVYHPDRLKYPMKRVGDRGEGKWQRISWEEALDTITSKLKEIGGKHGPNSVAWVHGSLGVVSVSSVIGLAGACQGTFIDMTGCGDAAGPCADIACYGAPWWYGEDYTTEFDNPALCLIWGENTVETEPFKWRKIRAAKEKGARLAVIDPRFTPTASKADEYVPIRRGTDAALALGMMNVILDRGLEDVSFISEHTVGPFLVRSDNGLFLREKDIGLPESQNYIVWDTRTDAPQSYDTPNVAPALTGIYRVKGVECKPAFHLLKDLVQQFPPGRASEITGVPADTIVRLAVEYGTYKPSASFRGMGCTRGSFHGDLSFRAINTLAALTGNISFRGHTPFELNRPALMAAWGLPTFITLLRFYDAVLTGEPFPIKALWITRHNLVNQDPNFNRITRELIPRLEFIAVTEMFMTTSAQYADIVLPGSSFFEHNDVVQPAGVAAHNYLQLQQKVIEPPYECRPDLDIMAEVAKRMGIDGCLTQTHEEYVELLLASGHPSMEGITLERLKESPMPPAAHSVPDFNTPSGRLEFYTERLKEFGQELPVYLEPRESSRTPLAQKYPLSLITAHTRYRYHSMFANVSWIRELDPEPVLEMNPADAAPRGIQDGDLVRAFNERGEVKLKARLHQGVGPGVVNICQGWSPAHYVAGTHQALIDNVVNLAQEAIFEPNAALFDTLVEVEKVEEA